MMQKQLFFRFLLIVTLFLCAWASPTHYGDHEGAQNDNDSSDERPALNKPIIVSRPENIVAREGESVSLPCEVQDLGQFVIVWKKGIATILYAGSLQVLKDPRFRLQKHSLLINDLRLSDEGDYVCQVSTNPTTEITHRLTVHERSHFPVERPQEPEVTPGTRENEVQVDSQTGFGLAVRPSGFVAFSAALFYLYNFAAHH